MNTQSTFFILIAILLLITGCAQTKQNPAPLAGWKLSWSQDPSKVDKAIRDDYQDYIQKLPPKTKSFIGNIEIYEDGKGQHAVKIERGVNGKYWYHVLFYDQQNKRSRVFVYADGGYRS